MSLLIISLFVALIIIYYILNKKKEHLSNDEAIQNIASIYNSANMSVTNLNVTGNLNPANFKGIIVAFSGDVSGIPQGWALCDGTNGTPDLRGRFILGAGQGTGLTERKLKDNGGEEMHTLTIDEILMTCTGAGYTVAPTITISGGGGTGAAATCGIITNRKGLVSINVTNGGVGYSTVPHISISYPSLSPNLPASAKAVVSAGGSVTSIRITDAGAGFFSAPTITVGSAATVGVGTYWFNEVDTGSISGATARVKTWDKDTSILKVGITNGTFVPGDIILGSTSTARYTLSYPVTAKFADKYEQNDEIEEAADLVVDFSESNPFGTY